MIAYVRAGAVAVLCLYLSLAFAGLAHAAILNVPSQFATINAALTAASAGDVIALDPTQGPYSDPNDLNLTVITSVTIESSTSTNAVIDCGGDNVFADLLAPQVTLQGLTIENSQDQPAVSIDNGDASTFINCDFDSNSDELDNASAVYVNSSTADFTGCTFNGNTGLDTVEYDGTSGSFTNCTFTNNTNTSGFGVINGNTGSVTITSCTFTGNTAGSNGDGGAINWVNGDLTVTDTSFTGNSAYSGGAIYYGAEDATSDATLTRCIFSGNSATSTGGAIEVVDSDHDTSITATDCLFTGNTSGADGSAVYILPANSTTIAMTLMNDSLYGNQATGSGAGAIAAASGSFSPLTITNSILYGNSPNEISTANPPTSTTIQNSDMDQGVTNGTNGNMTSDPKFESTTTGDLHLQDGSPCVDAGTSTGAPSTDYSQYPWGNSVSIGAFSPIVLQVTAPSTATAGTSFPVDVTALTADLSTKVTGYTGIVDITSSDGAALLPPNSTLTNGTGVFSVTLNSGGDQTVTATDTGEPPFTGTSSDIFVQALTSIVVTPGPSETYTLPVKQQFTAVANDQDGNPMSPQPSFTWYVGGGDAGAITYLGGLYYGGPTPGKASVRAFVGKVIGKSQVTLVGAPVTVAEAASAAPSPASHKTTHLSALGAYAGAGSWPILTYSWSATGPAAVTYTDNNDHSARNTIATFTAAGTYQLTVTITSPVGTSTTSGVSVTVDQTVASITVTPGPTLTVGTHARQQFTATVNDQFGNPLAVQPAINWQLGAGSVGAVTNAGGLYYSGAVNGSATVDAEVNGIVGSCAVTVN